MSRPAPASLTDASMRPVWDVVRRRLESRGLENRGRVRLPDLDQVARRSLAALLGRSPATTVHLGELERSLVELGVGADLAEALSTLGTPVSPDAAHRRAARLARQNAHDAARAAVSTWPESWADEWITDVISTGLLRGHDDRAAEQLVAAVRSVLDHLDRLDRLDHLDHLDAATVARNELAANVLGDSHALDRGSAIESATVRALRLRLHDPTLSDPWDAVGVTADQVSAPALTWALPLSGSSGLAPVVAGASGLGVPLHLSRFALRRYPVVVPSGTVVLVAENPRVVEAAAERGVDTAVISTNGNPSTTVRLLIDQLVDCGAVLRYHGDFDTPGLAIAARMEQLGLVPWRMTSDDYLAAVAAADRVGVDLPVESTQPGSTPWDPTLSDTFAARRLIVHEERVLDGLFEPDP